MRSVTAGFVILLWLSVLAPIACGQADQPGVTAPGDATESPPNHAQLQSAAQRAIQVIERSSAEYLKQRECFSCHHQAMSIMALMEARPRGLKIDMHNLHQQVQRTVEHLKRGEADYRQGKGQGGGVDTSGYALSALAAAGVPRSDTTDAVVHYLLEIHSAKKHWSVTGDRPPTQSCDLSTTSVAMRGLAYYFDAANAIAGEKSKGENENSQNTISAIVRNPTELLKKRIEDCDVWLEKQKPANTEERVCRIFISKTRSTIAQFIGTDAARLDLERTVANVQQQFLLQTQNSDGGWSQLPLSEAAQGEAGISPANKSDAYATATALYALSSSGLSAQHTAYVRGLKYLLDTQQADGSWHVATRSKPIQKYFESGFPHGVDQFLSMQATCWAVMALVQPLPVRAPAELPALPWLAAKAQLVAATEPPVFSEPTGEQLEFFEREIRPLLVENCISCHGPDDQSGQLRVDSIAGLLKGGESGPAIIAHSVDRSLMIKAVRRQDELKMPPNAPLSAINVSRLERWVEMGAPWPKNLDPKDIDKRRAAVDSHWAFQLPKRSPLPEVTSPESNHTAIDRWVNANLEKHGLTCNQPADRSTLLRRLSYDLIGLPPSAEDVSQFIGDDRPDAVERVIDRLLASPKFGEHWARHWLDVARYSDTKGYVYGREERFFVHAPLYRDWVVRSLADDLPYDQFVKLQVAADQIAPGDAQAQAAMGFLTIGRRFLGVTHDIIDDRIDVVSRGLLGLTVGCARCHDHKFDPIPTADYYSLYGVFQNSIERRVRLPDGRSAAELRAFEDEYLKRQRKYQEQLAAEQKTVNDRILTRVSDYLKAQLELEKYPAEGFDVLIQKDDLVPAQLRRIQAFLIDSHVRQEPIFAAWHRYLALPKDDFATQAVRVSAELQQQADGKVNGLIAKRFQEPPQSMQQVAEVYGQLLGRLDLVVCDNEAERAALQELKQFIQADNSPFRMPDEDIVSTEQFYETRVCEILWKLQGEVDRWIIQNGNSPHYATVLVDRTSIREPHILRRGNPRMIAERVPRQFLSVLCAPIRKTGLQPVTRSIETSVNDDPTTSAPLPRMVATNTADQRIERRPFEHGSGRRELAEAIADPRNPLTARVWVNRMWQHLFGQGLVSTPSDFGLRAAPPSHPELLDQLALDLVAHDYSSKHIIREIVSSSTYQQSSKSGDAASEQRFAKANDLDPDNRWLWRASSRRLTFEQQRDAWLTAAGQLDNTFGGRARQLFGEGPNTRRTLYGLVDRQFLSGVLRSFDFANPDLHIPQRSETTVPQQALFELNHEFTASVARSLAARVERSEVNSNMEDKVIAMFQYALGRLPSSTERAAAVEFIQQPDSAPKPRAEERDWKYGFGKFNAETNAIDGFTELPHFTGTAWQGGAKWPDDKLGWVQLTATGGHAGNDLEHAAVRRWIAPAAGIVQVRSTIVHNVPAGDGVRAIVIHSSQTAGNKTLKNEVAHNAQVDFHFEAIKVAAGDVLDFVVNFQANLNSDQFLWSPEIKMQEKSWQAERDFAGKQPNYLNPWQQLAQVLLMSNELVFID